MLLKPRAERTPTSISRRGLKKARARIRLARLTTRTPASITRRGRKEARTRGAAGDFSQRARPRVVTVGDLRRHEQ